MNNLDRIFTRDPIAFAGAYLSTAINANANVNADVLGNGTYIPGQVVYWTNA